MVIRDGNAWGLMMMSGDIPLVSLNGMSSGGQSMLITPFCPCLELNLSPITGGRFIRSVIEIFVRPACLLFATEPPDLPPAKIEWNIVMCVL